MCETTQRGQRVRNEFDTPRKLPQCMEVDIKNHCNKGHPLRLWRLVQPSVGTGEEDKKDNETIQSERAREAET